MKIGIGDEPHRASGSSTGLPEPNHSRKSGRNQQDRPRNKSVARD